MYEEPGQALALLEQARAQAPRHPGPLIALYRFHFYGHRLEQARAVGEDALTIARIALGSHFGDVPPSEEATRHDAAVRFYLFVTKGLAYLNLRLGELDEARMLLRALRHLDPKDIVGGGLLSHVLARHEAGGRVSTRPITRCAAGVLRYERHHRRHRCCWRCGPCRSDGCCPGACDRGSSQGSKCAGSTRRYPGPTLARRPCGLRRLQLPAPAWAPRPPGLRARLRLHAGCVRAPLDPLLPLASHAGCAQLTHPYFEVRAIAARHASVFRLTALMNDPDETVRLQVALRCP